MWKKSLFFGWTISVSCLENLAHHRIIGKSWECCNHRKEQHNPLSLWIFTKEFQHMDRFHKAGICSCNINPLWQLCMPVTWQDFICVVFDIDWLFPLHLASHELAIILLLETYLPKQEIKLESVLTVSSYVLMVNVFVFHLETLTAGINAWLY